MRKILPVADSGLVRLGAGMRRASTTPVTAAPTTKAAQQPVTAPAPRAPAAVADTGRVRLGAGMRRS